MGIFKRERKVPPIIIGVAVIFIILLAFLHFQPMGPSVQKIDPLLLKVKESNSDLLPNSLDSLGLNVLNVTVDRRVYVDEDNPWEDMVYLGVDVYTVNETESKEFYAYATGNMYPHQLTFRSVYWDCARGEEMSYGDVCGNERTCEVKWIESGHMFNVIGCGEELTPAIQVLTNGFSAAEDVMWFYGG